MANNAPQKTPPKKQVTMGQIKRQRRKMLVLFIVPLMLLAFGLAFWAMNVSAVYFYAPNDLPPFAELKSKQIRVGGLVKDGSYIPPKGNRDYHQFIITDLSAETLVTYKGLLPGLFREGQGVVTQGKLQANGTFIASRVMAKHDENYMPREVVDALEKSGQWKPDDQNQDQ